MDRAGAELLVVRSQVSAQQLSFSAFRLRGQLLFSCPLLKEFSALRSLKRIRCCGRSWAFTVPGPLMPYDTTASYHGMSGQVWGSHIYYEVRAASATQTAVLAVIVVSSLPSCPLCSLTRPQLPAVDQARVQGARGNRPPDRPVPRQRPELEVSGPGLLHPSADHLGRGLAGSAPLPGLVDGRRRASHGGRWCHD